MNKKLISAFVVFAFLAVVLHSCKKDDDQVPINEPIQFVLPDSAWTSAFPGDSVPLDVRFTTDRPIDSIWAYVHVDSTHQNMFVMADADSFFVVYPTEPNNQYTYTGAYYLPADSSISPLDVIRIQFTLYADTLVRSKQLRIDVK